MITGIVKGVLNDCFTKDWEVDGNKGTSYVLNVYQGNGVNEQVKVAKDVFPFYKDMLNKEVELECELYLAKGSRYNLKVKAE